MEYLILGSLEVTLNGRTLELGPAKQQTLLGVLLLRSNEVVSTERLVDDLWGESPPASAAKAVQGYVSALRKSLGSGAIVTKAPGYSLQVDGDRLDSTRFQRLAEEGRAWLDDDCERAAACLREALAIWRGAALEGLSFESLARNDLERLNEQRLAALEQRIEAELALGRHVSLVAELQQLVAGNPYRERLRRHLMLALYRSGRQAEALALYRETRSILSDGLGLEPSGELGRLEQQILAHAPELDLPERTLVAPHPPPTPAEPPVRTRRLVTVVVAHAVGATALAERLDPESMHGLLERFWTLCADLFERHGGAVERSFGDTVVGAFGLEQLHEDDALRAVRAAVDLRQAVAELGAGSEPGHGTQLAVSLGIESGEVFAGEGARGEALTAGDAIDVAAMLGRAAAGGEVLLGGRAHALVAPDVRAEVLEPLAVEGRARSVEAWRLVDVVEREHVLQSPSSNPFVGRERELAELERELARAEAGTACRLCTVVGPPGIGKSRLARELVDAAAGRATVVIGRCPSYGAGITYLPLAEIVRRLGDDPAARVAELLAAEERGELIASVVLVSVGLAEGQTRPEDTAWAFRRLFEALARERPLLAVFEDIHWADPPLHDLLESLAGFSSGAPILLLCLAREELLEQRPTWAVPQPNRALLVLEPLPETNARALVDHLASESLDAYDRARIVETAEGNPLFLEQLLAVHSEGTEPILPLGVQAVLATRIDRLPPGERTVLQRAAVEGRSFHRGALIELLPQVERLALDSHLTALVEKQLLRPDRARLAGEEAFRFAHLLIREAAYASLPKRLRAELHERVARWLEVRLDAEEELLAYHLEQAYRCLDELGALDETGHALGRRAGEQLLNCGLQAIRARGDLRATADLLERANALLPREDPQRLEAQPELASALIGTGRLAGARAVLCDALEAAREAGDERTEARALLELANLRVQTDAFHDFALACTETERLIGLFERLGDAQGVARASLELGKLQFWLGRCDAAATELSRGLALSDRAGDGEERSRVPVFLILAIAMGPTPADESIERVDRLLRERIAGGDARGVALACEAMLRALQGRFAEARQTFATSRATLREHGHALYLAGISMFSGPVELLAGDPEAAERELREGHDALERLGETAFRAQVAGELAEVLRTQGRLEEAMSLSRASERSAAPDDIVSQALWRNVRARVLAHRDEPEKAARIARESVALLEPTDLVVQQGTALEALAEVLRLAGEGTEAAAVLERAAALFDDKGAVFLADRARALLRKGSRTV